MITDIAIWKKKSAGGKEYFSVKVTQHEGDSRNPTSTASVNVFTNSFKKADNQPDFTGTNKLKEDSGELPF